MREKKLLKQRVSTRQTKRITSLLGLLVLIMRLSKTISQKSSKEIIKNSIQIQFFEEKLDSNSNKFPQNSTKELSLRRNNISTRAHGNKTKLKNFSVALSAFMTGVKSTKRIKSKFRRRNGSIFKRTQDPNLLSYQIWAMRKNGELSEEDLGFAQNLMKGFEEAGLKSKSQESGISEIFANNQYLIKKEETKYMYNKMSNTEHFVKRNNLGLISHYESYFRNQIDQLLSIRNLQSVNGLKGYYNLIRMNKSETVEIEPTGVNANVFDNIAEIDSFEKNGRFLKLKSVQDFKVTKERNFVKRQLKFEDYQNDSRGVLKKIDICLRKIFKDLVREKVILFNFKPVSHTQR